MHKKRYVIFTDKTDMIRNIIFLLFLLTLYLPLQSQEIIIDPIPAWGSEDNLKGKVMNIDPLINKILVYIFVEEAGAGWWIKPGESEPLAPIDLTEHTFEVDITTGGMDIYAIKIIAFAVPSTFDPPILLNQPIPASLYNYPYKVIARPRGSRTLNWSGHEWIVKKTVNDIPVGPGNNLFSDDPANNVWVDDDDYLHLAIHVSDGKAYCSEIISASSFGYGEYSFTLQSNADLIPLEVVLGFFTWDDISPFDQNPNEYYREIDVEVSRWGNALDPNNSQYVIQPWDRPGNLERYDIGEVENTVHSFEWLKNEINFVSVTEENSTPISSWVYTGVDLPGPGAENIRFNLWLMQAKNTEHEVVIKSFQFTYPLDAPTNAQASDGTDSTEISISWEYSGSGSYFGIYRNTEDNPDEATLLTHPWVQSTSFNDVTAGASIEYWYWVRAADNPEGSNTTGYASDFSNPDQGWRKDFSDIIELKNQVRIFPNPFNSQLTIHFSTSEFAPTRIKIFDLAGRVLLEEAIADSQGSYHWRPGSHIKQGVYLVEVLDRDNRGLYNKVTYLK